MNEIEEMQTKDLQEMLAFYYAEADTLLLLDRNYAAIYNELKKRNAGIPMLSRWELTAKSYPAKVLVYELF